MPDERHYETFDVQLEQHSVEEGEQVDGQHTVRVRNDSPVLVVQDMAGLGTSADASPAGANIPVEAAGAGLFEHEAVQPPHEDEDRNGVQSEAAMAYSTQAQSASPPGCDRVGGLAADRCMLSREKLTWLEVGVAC